MPPRKKVIPIPTTPQTAEGSIPPTPAASTTTRTTKPRSGGKGRGSVPMTPVGTTLGSGSGSADEDERGKGGEELDSDDLDGEGGGMVGNGKRKAGAKPPSQSTSKRPKVEVLVPKSFTKSTTKSATNGEIDELAMSENEDSKIFQAAKISAPKPRLSLPLPRRPSLQHRPSSRSQNPLSRLTTPLTTPGGSVKSFGESIGEHDSRNELESGGSGEEREAWEEFAGDDSELRYSDDSEIEIVKPTRRSAQKKKGAYKLPSLSPSLSAASSGDEGGGGGFVVPKGKGKAKAKEVGKGKGKAVANGKGKGKAKMGGKVDNPYEVDSDEEGEGEMMKAAIKASLQDLKREEGEGSRGGKGARSKEAEKRARAVEKRLGIKQDPDAMDISSPSESDFQADDSEDDLSDLPGDSETSSAVLTRAYQSAGLGGGAGDQQRIMDLAGMKREKKEKKAKLDEEMKEVRGLQLLLKKQLGRKLTWAEKNQVALSLHHPEVRDVWGDLEAKIAVIKPVPMEAHPSLKLTLLPFQKESLYWMKKQEEGPWKGGMLADEMGMGKTIQTIALLLSEPRDKPSLVIAPVVALMQWKHEIETHAEGFTVCLWHGTSKMKISELKKFDVVLTSYGTLEAAFRKQQRGFKKGNVFVTEKSPMHSFEWYRIILDEAHNIKERSTNAAKATFALEGKYKWCLSGTPLQNRVGELYSLIRFLGGDPFAYYYCMRCSCKSLSWLFSNKRECDDCGHSPMQHTCWWNQEILSPIQKHSMSGPGEWAFKKLKILLDRMMLRRTKIERADDLGLPPRTIVVRRDYFSPEEKELYMGLFQDTQRQFSTYIAAGTVLNNYSNIFSLITRMRQMACHPDLVLRSKTAKYVENATEAVICRICNDTAEDAIVSKCHHVFDRACIRDYLESSERRIPDCPVCHLDLTIDLTSEAIEQEEDGTKKGKQGILGRLDLDNWRSSTKLEALVEELTNLREKDCTIKSLVFSQFVSFLDLIAFRLQKAGFNICRLEGGMTPQARDNTIQHFMKSPQVTVFLVSLKAGGVALNLTEASRVYMMDSWWNPSVEYQAMDRIHRLGQHRPVTVIKLVVQDSIESKIVQLQEKKLQMMQAALAKDGEQAMGKLTPEDLQFLFKL